VAPGDDIQGQVPVAQPALPDPVPAVQGGAKTAGTTPAQPTLPPPRIYRRRLANLRNVRCALADALRDLEAGTTEPGKARVLIYGYSVLAGIIQGTDLEGRIAALERAR
jgi:hypothetical protein